MKPILFSLLLCSGFVASAQINTYSPKFLEAGGTLGLTNYSGDLAEKTIQLTQTRFDLGVFARYHFSNYFAAKAQVSLNFISGSDKNAITQELKERSLRFKSSLLEFSMVGEWNFMNVKPPKRGDIQEFRVVPYLHAGIGGVRSNPKVTYYGPPDDFAKNVPYPIPEKGPSSVMLVIPFGMGLRAQLNDQVNVGIEAGFRPVFSDYLDGVKLNGKSNRDWYYTAIATVSYALTR
jgi:hypothetical protein